MNSPNLLNLLKKKTIISFVGIFSIVLVLISGSIFFPKQKEKASDVANVVMPTIIIPTLVPLPDCFSATTTLEEVGSIPLVSKALWWVNSGSRAIGSNGICKTVQGNLPDSDPWRTLYSKNNPTDTDNGYHPQNLFRLVSLKSYRDYYQQVYFKINKINLSTSANRNQSNGVLLFNRYQDDDNLYYLGLRVDGYAILKKKQKGIYYTLAEKQIFTGTYNRNSKPNLLPVNTWVGIKAELVNLNDTSVRIRFFLDKNSSGNWEQAFEFVDNSQINSKVPILKAGYGGIRSDFMDVEFKGYKVQGTSL